MKVLVFGKTGQVATELGRQYDVTALGRAQADLSNPEQCADIIRKSGADVVINAAAYTQVDKAEIEADLAMTINGEAPRLMAQACAEKDIPFVHISTDYVFDGSSETPWQVDHPTAPLGVYGRTKLAGERGILATDCRAVILRTSWVFSAHGGNFVKTMLRLSETRDQLTVVSDQIGGPTAAADIAQTCLKIAKTLISEAQNSKRTGLYHYSSAPDASWADFAREIFKQSGRETQVQNIPSVDYPTPAKRPMNSRLNCERLLADFGIDRPDWKQSLSAVLQELNCYES